MKLQIFMHHAAFSSRFGPNILLSIPLSTALKLCYTKQQVKFYFCGL